MIDLILDNINIVGATTGIIVSIVLVIKKKQHKAITVFRTTQIKGQFKKHQLHFNKQFEQTNMFK